MYQREHWTVENYYEQQGGWIEIKDSENLKEMEKLYKKFKNDGYTTRLIKRTDFLNIYEEIVME